MNNFAANSTAPIGGFLVEAVLQGEYHWHKHEKEDEFYFVIEGRFFIDLEERSVELTPRQGFVVPRGVIHRTRAPEKTVLLMVENVGIVPTGDA